MEDIIKTIRIGNKELRIFRDEDSESPREWDNLGKMVCFHRRYTLGDKHDFKTPSEFDAWIKRRKVVMLPLYLLDHSGISMQTHDFGDGYIPRFDSGQVGYIYATYKNIKENFGLKTVGDELIKRTKEILEGEVRTYDMFLRGEVYGFQLVKIAECEKCKKEEEETIDSVWGFYGDDFEQNGMLENLEDKWKIELAKEV